MAASLDKITIARVLLGKTAPERALIKSQAEAVAFSFSSSISALSQSNSFNRDDANVVLAALAMVGTMLAANPEATADTLPQSMGFEVRRQPIANPQGVTWGC